MVFINNPVHETWIFSGLLCLGLLLTLRIRKDKDLFPIHVTQELKGFAILAIVFAHIGYSLSANSGLLWPLSNLAGVGVNIFLFTSGFGLTESSLKKNLNIRQFYSRRLKKLYVPFWLVLGMYFLPDYFVLDRTYSVQYVTRAFAGIFTTADIWSDVNSPLWYFTMIAFYYLIYPLFFIRKRPWLSAVLIFTSTYIVLHYSPIGTVDTAHFYEVYTVAFPLGIVAAWLHTRKHGLQTFTSKAVQRLSKLANSKPVARRFGNGNEARHILNKVLLLALVGFVIFSRFYSSPWDSVQKEQIINVLTMLLLVLFFVLKRMRVRLLYALGLYSYEIYLLHWPLMSRYDVFFRYAPAWAAVALYLVLLLALGRILNTALAYFEKPVKS